MRQYADEDICFISIDIEHYKFFGEWFGREKGDLLLAKIGEELTRIESEYHGLAGYFGQDDFAMIMKYDPVLIHNIYVRLRGIMNTFGLTGGLLPALGVAHIEDGMTIHDIPEIF